MHSSARIDFFAAQHPASQPVAFVGLQFQHDPRRQSSAAGASISARISATRREMGAERKRPISAASLSAQQADARADAGFGKQPHSVAAAAFFVRQDGRGKARAGRIEHHHRSAQPHIRHEDFARARIAAKMMPSTCRSSAGLDRFGFARRLAASLRGQASRGCRLLGGLQRSPRISPLAKRVVATTSEMKAIDCVRSVRRVRAATLGR